MQSQQKKIIPSLLPTIGLIVLALAVILVPFSASHSTPGTVHDAAVLEHLESSTGFDLSHMNHGLESCEHCTNNDSSHNDHSGSNCCSSICGGALIAQSGSLDCMAIFKKTDPARVAALEPGKWVPPFRPPST